MLTQGGNVLASRSIHAASSAPWLERKKTPLVSTPQQSTAATVAHRGDSQLRAKSKHRRRALDKALEERAAQNYQGRMHALHTPSYPAQRPRQQNLGAQDVGCGLLALRVLDGSYHRLDLGERAG
jgi:hypothetical protein